MKPVRSRRRMSTWLVLLPLAPVLLWAFFRWFERTNVYHPSRAWWATGAELNRAWDDLWLRTADGVELSAWFFPASGTAEFRDVAVLISHGNGGNLSHRLPLYRLLLDLGVNVLAYDYRGYGRSAGRPTEAGTYADGETALEWLKSKGFAEDRVVVHGESLGGGIAAELALRRPGLRGLILQSTFTSVPDLGCELFPFLPVRTLSTIAYDTRAKLPRIRVPVLFLHSRSDTLIRFAHAESNFAAANAPKTLREIEGDHNNQPEVAPERFAAAVREFLRTPVPAPAR
jgi:fermentation-respiration switch protein FrsA (DUF1100 family)